MRIKPPLWNVSAARVDPKWRELWRDATILPMLETSGSKVASFGNHRESPTWTSTSTTGIERKVTTLGPALSFNNPTASASDQDYIEYNWLPNFGAMTVVVVMELNALVFTNYYEQYVTQGSNANDSNFAFGFRHSKRRLFLDSHEGANGRHTENDVPSAAVTTHTPHVIAARRDANSNVDLYWDGILLPTTGTPTTGTPGTSTAKLRVGAGTGTSSSSRGVIFGDRIFGVALWPRRLPTEAILRVTDDFFEMVTMADDYPAWMPVPVSSIPFPPLFHRDVESRTRLRM